MTQTDSPGKTSTLSEHPEIQDFLNQWTAELLSRDVYREQEWRAFDRWIEMRERMDYWVTGLAGAVLAYAVQSYDAGLVPNFRWLAPVSWAFLLLSVGMGLRGLAMQAKGNLAFYQKVWAERKVRKYTTTLEMDAIWKKLGLDRPVGLSKEDMAEMEHLQGQLDALVRGGLEQMQGSNTKADVALARLEQRGLKAARLRSLFFLLGLATLASLRLLNLQP